MNMNDPVKGNLTISLSPFHDPGFGNGHLPPPTGWRDQNPALRSLISAFGAIQRAHPLSISSEKQKPKANSTAPSESPPAPSSQLNANAAIFDPFVRAADPKAAGFWAATK